MLTSCNPPLPVASFCNLTWKTLAAETRHAKAEDRVAPKMPAVIRGAKADTMLMVCGNDRGLSQKPYCVPLPHSRLWS